MASTSSLNAPHAQGVWHMHYGRPEGCVRWQDLQAFERNSGEAIDQARLLAWDTQQRMLFRCESAASW